MMRIVIEILVSLAVLSLGILIQVLCLREPANGWLSILKRFKSLDGRLLGLSHDEMFSEGLVVPTEELYDVIGGREGLRAICDNTNVLMDVIAHIADVCVPSEEFSEDRYLILAYGTKAILLLLAALVASHCVPGTPLCAVSGVRAYVKLRAKTSFAIKDYCPTLLPEFRSYLLTGGSSASSTKSE